MSKKKLVAFVVVGQLVLLLLSFLWSEAFIVLDAFAYVVLLVILLFAMYIWGNLFRILIREVDERVDPKRNLTKKEARFMVLCFSPSAVLFQVALVTLLLFQGPLAPVFDVPDTMLVRLLWGVWGGATYILGSQYPIHQHLIKR